MLTFGNLATIPIKTTYILFYSVHTSRGFPSHLPLYRCIHLPNKTWAWAWVCLRTPPEPEHTLCSCALHGLSPGTYEAVRPRLLCRFRPLVIKLKRVHSFIQSCGKHFLSACPVPGTGNWRYKNEGLTFAHVKPQPRAKD